jgi:hypothetical protein
MNLSDELERLGKLRKDGLLTEQEFALAKSKLLQADAPAEDRGDYKEENSLGAAANRFVSFQMVMAAIGLILFLILFFTVFLPHFRAINNDFPGLGPGSPFH